MNPNLVPYSKAYLTWFFLPYNCFSKVVFFTPTLSANSLILNPLSKSRFSRLVLLFIINRFIFLQSYTNKFNTQYFYVKKIKKIKIIAKYLRI